MAKPNVLVLTGYGINCDDETAFAFKKAGATAKIVHVNDLIASPDMLDKFQIFSFPGGFSYGDDVGSGKALANKIKNIICEELRKFIDRDTLMLGICNGFQVMVNMGIVPGLDRIIGDAQVSLEYNKTFRYECRWVELMVEKKSPAVFTRGIERLHIPVAHGEGNFFAAAEMLEKIEKAGLVTLRYSKPDGSRAGGKFPYNPNGALNDVAAICDKSGRIMGMMPHPERNIFFTQRDDWTYLKEKAKRNGSSVPEEGEGMAIFRNAVGYFQ